MNPTLIENTPQGREQYDVISRLFKDRIIYIRGEVNEGMATTVTAQLLALEAMDNTAPIHMYINSPGGVVSDGLAIVDTMNIINAPVYTTVLGLAASMGTIIASSGEVGHRLISPHSKYLIHQPMGGAQGQQTEIEIAYKQITKTRTELAQILADNSKKPLADVERDIERDYWMDAQETVDYGLADAILTK